MAEEIYGCSFPFRIDDGAIAVADGAEKIKENITHILLTGVGERVMRRDYGGGLQQLVHDPNNAALHAVVQHQIAKSIGTWEPRVMLQDIAVTQEQGTLTIKLIYLIRRTQQPQSVSIPLRLGGV